VEVVKVLLTSDANSIFGGKKIQKDRVLICESTRHVLFLKKGKTAKSARKRAKLTAV
jgi:hypothetical protein